MEPEYSSIDQLCLWVAGAEWRVVSECNSLLSQTYSFRESQSMGLHAWRRLSALESAAPYAYHLLEPVNVTDEKTWAQTSKVACPH